MEENQTTEDWASVLKLASKWSFESLRDRAIAKVAEAVTSPIDQVLLGRKYDAPDLLILGYTSLCQSPVPLSYEEGVRLGMKEVIGIYQLRYELYGSDSRPSVPSHEVLDKVKIYTSSRVGGDTTGGGHGSNLNRSDIDGKKTSAPTSPASTSALSLRTSDTGADRESGPASEAPDPQQGVPEALPTSVDGSELQAPNPVFEFDRDNAPALGIGFAPPSDTSDDIQGATNEDGAGDDLSSYSRAHRRHRPDPSDWEVIVIPSGSSNHGSGTGLTSSAVNDDRHYQQTPLDVLTVEGIGERVPFEGEQTNIPEPSIEHPIIPNALNDNSRATSVAIPDPSDVAIQALLNGLTAENFDSVYSVVITWVNSDPTGSQMFILIAQLVVKKAVEEVGQSKICCRLCNKIHSNGKATTGKRLFYIHLKQNFERIFAAAVSVVSLERLVAVVVGELTSHTGH